MKKGIFIGVLTLFAVHFVRAQDTIQTERLIIIKPYSPTVSDAFKVEQMPEISDSITSSKKEPEYTMIKVPVASTFVPEKGTAATVETGPRESLYDTYALLGFGNYTQVLAELYSTFQFSDAESLNFFLTHNSSQGGIEKVLLDDKFYDTELGLNFSANGTYYNWGVELGAMHQLVNWYGLPDSFADPMIINAIDPQQNYFGVSMGGVIEYYEGLFDRAELSYRHFGDAYGSGENHLRFMPEFGLLLGDQTISLNLFVDYVSGHFDRNYETLKEINYSNLNLGAHPSLAIHAGDFNMELGAALVYTKDMERANSDLFIYPKIKASYRVADGYFVPYVGVDGGLEQNTYYDFVQENPFVSPTLHITPTSHVYNAFLGARGKFTENVGYDFKATYARAENEVLFLSNASDGSGMENYHYGNSFGIVYDNLNTLGLHGELSVNVNENFQLRMNASYYSYETEFQQEAWNLPNLKASLNANYQISKKWSFGTDLFFVGERKELPALRSVIVAPQIITLDSYFDVNVELGYQINDQFSVFVKGNNLLGENYEHWKNFPVLGTQVLGGLTYQFDW